MFFAVVAVLMGAIPEIVAQVAECMASSGGNQPQGTACLNH